MINLYYDDITRNNCLINGSSAVLSHNTIIQHFKWCDMEYSLLSIDQFKKGECDLYVIEPQFVQEIETIFENISQDAKVLLTNGDLKLLIYFPYQNFRFDLYDDWFGRMHECFVKHNLESTKKYFVYGHLYVRELYESMSFESKFTDVFPFALYHLEYYKDLMDRDPSEFVEVDKIYDKDKDFFSLNAKVRHHRVLLVSELSRRNILNNGYVSFLGGGWYDDNNMDVIKRDLNATLEIKSSLSSECYDYLKQYVESWAPLILDHGSDDFDYRANLKKCYEKSYFHVVTETGMDFPMRFTEKIFKPIANYQPFLVIGCQGTLEYLRNMGYETFPEMFDESYDQESDPVKRIMMVLDQIEKFVALKKSDKDRLFNSVKDKLLKNVNLFYNHFPNVNISYYRNIFQEIYND